MQGVFPEALSSLKNADPELFSIIEDEKERQWYVQKHMRRLVREAAPVIVGMVLDASDHFPAGRASS